MLGLLHSAANITLLWDNCERGGCEVASFHVIVKSCLRSDDCGCDEHEEGQRDLPKGSNSAIPALNHQPYFLGEQDGQSLDVSFLVFDNLQHSKCKAHHYWYRDQKLVDFSN